MPSLKISAMRHFEAAETVNKTNRRDVAGYLYGISTECAIKQVMLQSGMRPQEAGEKRDDPFYAHFEVLKTILRDTVQGRLRAELSQISSDSKFMQYWDTSMRYSEGREIKEEWILRWRDNALHAIAMLDM